MRRPSVFGERGGPGGNVSHWLSILVRKLLRRGNFRSIDDLRTQVLKFIDYFNRTMARPFKWTYQGKPLHA
jgi:hypothetical protein